ncbi:hypothetical protein NDU88_003478 [Pleurodeles waltl]|uniref:Uncharacterized protein n=1 Tax=Pleurodeles waltl TaxID=8319 RepID=A0AAV7LFG0_PLEWA|nr:hypothetical protein NDU88_003478 [Pleurodeles waltl]
MKVHVGLSFKWRVTGYHCKVRIHLAEKALSWCLSSLRIEEHADIRKGSRTSAEQRGLCVILEEEDEEARRKMEETNEDGEARKKMERTKEDREARKKTERMNEDGEEEARRMERGAERGLSGKEERFGRCEGACRVPGEV